MSEEVRIGVTVYGPQPEIDRFIELFIVDDNPDSEFDERNVNFERVIPLEPSETEELGGRYQVVEAWRYPHSFSSRPQSQRGEYAFVFSTDYDFPTPVFERLAEMFPRLAFNCSCMHEADDFCGYGWFNTPEGGEDFGFADVPPGYWDHGITRSVVAELCHQAVLARVREAAKND